MAKRKRRSKSTAKVVSSGSSKKSATCCWCGASRTWLVVCGLVLLILGVLLWRGMWGLDRVFGLLLVLTGLLKIFIGLKA